MQASLSGCMRSAQPMPCSSKRRQRIRAHAATVGTAASPAAALAAAAPAPAAADAPAMHPEQMQQVCDILESSLQASAAAAAPQHHWGQGLSVKAFTAALQALPMQQQLRWKTLYPAIGTGSRGKVYQAVNLDTGGVLAVKVVSLKHLMGDSYEAGLRREALVLELAAMQDFAHPNLLTMQGFHFHASKKDPRLEIYSELGCSLEDLMPEEEGAPRLGLGLVQKVMSALVGALAHLHERGVVHRDVKPGNIVSFGSSGTFKLIDMDSLYYTRSWEEDASDDESATDSEVPLALQQQHQQHQQQVVHGGMAGHPCPASLSAHLAGGAAARVAVAAAAAALLRDGDSSEPQQQQQQQLNALTFAGTPENMAPEVAPTVVQLAVVLWDLFPLQEGQQVASSTAIAPAQDIWSTGTVLYELLTGRSLFGELESPEQLYQHFSKLRDSSSGTSLPAMPSLGPGLDASVLAVLEACLRLDPAARPTARELLEMEFFCKEY